MTRRTRVREHGAVRYGLAAALFLVTAGILFGVVALLVSIFEHKQEAKNPFFRVVELTDQTEAPETWGKNFPLQFDGYSRTVDMQRTRFGGSEALPQVPSSSDPRSVVTQSRLALDPRLKRMWAGYAFAADFREERGHAYMLDDQIYTKRQQAAAQPGTCLHCHASVYVPYRQLGDGDLFQGFEKMNKMPYAEARQHVKFPITCLDCHDPQTMQLRITRPAFIEDIRLVREQAGIKNYDVNKMATRQEMRSFVCGQCHVEYYFKGPEKRLTYPWHNGLRADDILAYYDAGGLKDWVHAESGAPVLKAQHPEFEMWSQGIHARAGVACADCHMPYKRTGAMKISDHHIRSPLLNINSACQTCHKAPEEELKMRAEKLQERTDEVEGIALDALLGLIDSIKQALAEKLPEDRVNAARDYQRKAQFLIDFVGAENSMGFHADQEAVRVLAKALDFARKGEQALRVPAGK